MNNRLEAPRSEREGQAWQTYDVLYKSRWDLINEIAVFPDTLDKSAGKLTIQSRLALDEAEWMGRNELRRVAQTIFRIHSGEEIGGVALAVPAALQIQLYRNLLNKDVLEPRSVLAAYSGAIGQITEPVENVIELARYASEYGQAAEKEGTMAQAIKTLRETFPPVSLFPAVVDDSMMENLWLLAHTARKHEIDSLASFVLPYLEQMTDPQGRHMVHGADTDAGLRLMRVLGYLNIDPEKDGALVSDMVDKDLERMSVLARSILIEMTDGTFVDMEELPPIPQMLRSPRDDESLHEKPVFSYEDCARWLHELGYDIVIAPQQELTDALVGVYMNFQDAAARATEYFASIGNIEKAYGIWRQIGNYDTHITGLQQIQQALVRRRDFDRLAGIEQELRERYPEQNEETVASDVEFAYEYIAKELAETQQSHELPTFPDWVQQRCLAGFERHMDVFNQLVKDVAALPAGHVMRRYVSSALARRLAEAKRFMEPRQMAMRRAEEKYLQIHVDDDIAAVSYTPHPQDDGDDVPAHWLMSYEQDVFTQESDVIFFLNSLLYWQRFS